jgi:RNA polymerase sigma-70 factor (ECF subfamily)
LSSADHNQVTDAELLHRFVDGDDAAFTDLVVRHHESLERWVRRCVGPRAEVDDIVQETLMAVMSGAASFRGEGSARTWIFGIARHRISRQFRRHSAEPDSFETLEDLGLRAGWGDPELAASRTESVERVQHALNRLNPEAREVIVLRDIEGFTNPEAAEVLGLEIPAVKSRLHRARLALMADLSEDMTDG